MLTFGLLALGLGLSLFFLGLTIRDKRLWVNILKAIMIALFAWGFFAQGANPTPDNPYDREVGVLFLVALFCLITPISGWIQDHSRVLSMACGAVVIGAMMVQPDWMKNW